MFREDPTPYSIPYHTKVAAIQSISFFKQYKAFVDIYHLLLYLTL
jgi:hypothetical protein